MVVHVAVAVIINQDDEFLITRRSSDQHQGDKWEFPGGKVENNETSQEALSREIREELGIEIQSAIHITDIIHEYVDDNKKVLLDFFEVKSWLGEPKGLEGQPIRWVKRKHLSQFDFPKANDEILAIL